MTQQQRLYAFLDLIEKRRPGSRCLAAPDLVQHEGSYAIYFPSPADRRKLSFWIWIDDCDETSISFADWHTHGSVACAFSPDTPDESILAIALGILESRFVAAIDADGAHVGFSTVVWIDDADAVSAMFSNAWSPTRIHVRSWDGSIATTITAKSPPMNAT